MKKTFLTLFLLSSELLIIAQSTKEQAEKAGNNAFGNAMIRNVLIIIGVAVLYFIIKRLFKKKEK